METVTASVTGSGGKPIYILNLQSAIGKSSCVIKFIEGTFTTEIDPTMEFLHKKTLVHGEKTLTLEIFDVNGGEGKK
jgi:GTPase SAR1 family protein